MVSGCAEQTPTPAAPAALRNTVKGLKQGLCALARSGRTRQCKSTAYAYRLRAKGRGKAKLRKRSLLLSVNTKARQVAVQLL